MAKTNKAKKERPKETVQYVPSISDELLFNAGIAFEHECTVLLRRWVDEKYIIKTQILSVKAVPLV